VRPRLRLGNVVVALALGAAAATYGVRYLRNFPRSSQAPGVWDLVGAVVTDPRFLTTIVLTTVLVRMALRRERVLPEMLRRGTNRRLLLADMADATRSMVLPLIAILAACFVVAAVAGLRTHTLGATGSATGYLMRAGINPLVGIGLQVILAGCSLLAIQTLLSAIRIVSGSVIPVVVAAAILWAWGSVSVLQLQTVVTRSSGASIAESLQGGVIAALNSGAYLDVLITIAGNALEFVTITLVVAVAASFAAVSVIDLRIVHSRQKSYYPVDRDPPAKILAGPHHPSH
jgi:hypothetical protein